jgi:hypothetical protein
MDKPDVPDLDELARTQREALEAALEEMVNSGFGDLESQSPRGAPAPAPTLPPVVGWWW